MSCLIVSSSGGIVLIGTAPISPPGVYSSNGNSLDCYRYFVTRSYFEFKNFNVKDVLSIGLVAIIMHHANKLVIFRVNYCSVMRTEVFLQILGFLILN